MKVAVLGCGPAGLLAAYAVELAGHEVKIFSVKEKSVLPGAMYLHSPIAGLCDSRQVKMITYEKLGTKEGYAAKVYGDHKAPCSWERFPEGEQKAWNIRYHYDALWQRYEPRIVGRRLDFPSVRSISAEVDKVISSVPAYLLCHKPGDISPEEAATARGDRWIQGERSTRRHSFASRKIWIRAKSTGIRPDHDPLVVYNGDPMDPWYRSSRIFGEGYTEYGHYVQNGKPGLKPLSMDCDCLSNVVRVGRFGQWQRGVLAHTAFFDTMEALGA